MRARLLPLLVLAVLASGLMPAQGAVVSSRGYVTSFDGTPIVYNLFLPDDSGGPWPVILNGHGWGGSGGTGTGGFTGTLLSNGYAVLTWDSRGFGQSGGEAYVDDPNHEVKDTQALIDMVTARPEILKESAGDPALGMIGGSYAGGIQLATAAFDDRVDAIVPQITWHDLRYSLFPGGVAKLGFDQGLYATGLLGALSGGLNQDATAGPQAGNYSAELHAIEVKGTTLGYADAPTLSWFAERSMVGYGADNPVRIPTLIQQGNTDALFNVNEAVDNYNAIAATGAPVKLMVFCGGHVPCPSNYNGGPAGYTNAASLRWLNRYVKGNTGVDTGAPVEYLTNDGVWHQANTGFEHVATNTVIAAATGTIVSTGAKTSRLNVVERNDATAITYATPSDPRDPGTLTIPTAITGGTTIVGIPKIKLTVTGAGNGAHLFVKLVDREYNQVIDLEEAAIRVESIDPVYPQVLRFDGVGVCYTVPEGHHIDVQISTSSGAMSEYRGAAVIDLDAVVKIPTL